MLTKPVSRIGIKRMSTGIEIMEARLKNPVPPVCLELPEMVRQARVKPMNRLPASPMNMEAGLKLKTRKPRIAPKKAPRVR